MSTDWVKTLPPGDIIFKNYELDVQELATKFGKALGRFHRIITEFNLLIEAPKWAQTSSYWNTIRTKEPVNLGELAHFEIILQVKQMKSAMLGAIEETNLQYFEFGSYLGMGKNGVSLYLSNNSCYSATGGCDKGEFMFIEQKPDDRMGIFFDMRERNHGFMFLTYNGQVVGQMHKDLTAPIYPALSLTNVTKEEAVDFDTNCILRSKEAPIGYNDDRFRQTIPYRLKSKGLLPQRK